MFLSNSKNKVKTSNKKTSNKKTSNKKTSNKKTSNKETSNKKTSNKGTSNKETSKKKGSKKKGGFATHMIQNGEHWACEKLIQSDSSHSSSKIASNTDDSISDISDIQVKNDNPIDNSPQLPPQPPQQPPPILSGGCCGGKGKYLYRGVVDDKLVDFLKRSKKIQIKRLKEMTKEKLMKKCKKFNIKITTKKNGVIKSIKKETLINKIVSKIFY